MARLERRARPPGPVRAAEPGYPFYGRPDAHPAHAWAALTEGRRVLVEPGLLLALGAGRGHAGPGRRGVRDRRDRGAGRVGGGRGVGLRAPRPHRPGAPRGHGAGPVREPGGACRLRGHAPGRPCAGRRAWRDRVRSEGRPSPPPSSRARRWAGPWAAWAPTWPWSPCWRFCWAGSAPPAPSGRTWPSGRRRWRCSAAWAPRGARSSRSTWARPWPWGSWAPSSAPPAGLAPPAGPARRPGRAHPPGRGAPPGPGRRRSWAWGPGCGSRWRSRCRPLLEARGSRRSAPSAAAWSRRAAGTGLGRGRGAPGLHRRGRGGRPGGRPAPRHGLRRGGPRRRWPLLHLGIVGALRGLRAIPVRPAPLRLATRHRQPPAPRQPGPPRCPGPGRGTSILVLLLAVEATCSARSGGRTDRRATPALGRPGRPGARRPPLLRELGHPPSSGRPWCPCGSPP
jgi:hypothetical protein